MATQTLDRNGIGPRTAAQTLVLLATPAHQVVLRLLASGPKQQVELKHEAESLSQKALRECLRTLERIGAIGRRRRNILRGSREYELTEPGRELRFVGSVLDRWLAARPDHPLQLGTRQAKAVTSTLAAGWSSTVFRALAAKPRSPNDLRKAVAALDPPNLETMCQVGLLESLPRDAHEPSYVVTEWLRLGIGPIVAASRWERRNLPEQTATIGQADAETALMLTMPLVRLPIKTTGRCRLTVELSEESEEEPGSVTVDAENGAVVSCVPGGSGADASATGAPTEWFRAAIEADPDHLRVRGNRRLARALLESIYDVLFGRARRATFRY